LKAAIAKLQASGVRLGQLQQQKASAVRSEDFERAERLKQELDALWREVCSFLLSPCRGSMGRVAGRPKAPDPPLIA
jgi:hypothetical protein